ncbi:Zn-ribbon domain-containing OB-fold protein [Pseudomonas asiatica]|uniref:Zn-ribbon domain-containing OB-fold protein n=1 Tax=Pseudomonas asiatica TaxID=2219225 RepID=UPI002E7BFC76|nr:Zn-ribbon domain-containing OB-fold protein [Pseudomonas asiatica]MEE1916324.1 Zn-ribbon domain-containing OB-fold protein [Pseudomonas asiatica]
MTHSLSRALPGEHVHITTDPWTEPFWLAAKEGRLVAAQCSDCQTFRMPPTPYCPHCQSQNTSWPQLSGRGTVYSYAVCNRSPFPGVEDFVYIPVVVELDDAPGIRLVSNLIDIDPAAVSIGMAVTVDWNPITEGWQQPVFRAA